MEHQKKPIQIYQQLKNQIVSGVFPKGKRLPTENALAQQYEMSRQTVRKALSMLEEQHYIRRQQGSGSFVTYTKPARKSSKRIAVITTYISEYILPDILRAIEQLATQNGYSVIIRATNNSIMIERRILYDLMQDSIDGIITEGTKTALPNPNTSLYFELADKNVPIVFINGYYSGMEHNNIISVTTDDYNGGVQAVQMLIEKGHRAIGGIFKSDDNQGIRRFAGVIDGSLQCNVDIDDRHILWFITENKYTFLNEMTENFQEMLHTCTAIVCYSDQIAQLLLNILDREESTITSVISFDRTSILLPRKEIEFYSLNHPKEELGRIAVEKLLRMMRGEMEASVVMPWGK